MKRKVKLSLFANDMILYTENSKETTRKLLEPSINSANLTYRKIFHLYTLTMNYQNEKLKELYHLPLHQKE